MVLVGRAWSAVAVGLEAGAQQVHGPDALARVQKGLLLDDVPAFGHGRPVDAHKGTFGTVVVVTSPSVWTYDRTSDGSVQRNAWPVPMRCGSANASIFTPIFAR